jgi:hypothetical protein
MLKKTNKSYGTLVLAFVLTIALFAYATAGAAEFETIKLTTPGDVVVLDKAPNGIFVKDRSFPPLTFILVTSSSTIRGPEGKRMTFTQLPIPCRATVSSRTSKQEHFPVLVTLDVLSYGKNAKKAFTMKEKFRYRPH